MNLDNSSSFLTNVNKLLRTKKNMPSIELIYTWHIFVRIFLVYAEYRLDTTIIYYYRGYA